MLQNILLKTLSIHLRLVLQLQGLVAELREGLHAALTELGELRHRDHSLEEKLQAHQTDVDDKIMGLKNSLNTFKVLRDAAQEKHTHIYTQSILREVGRSPKHNLEHLTGTLLKM